ncbi:MAG: type VI secretion system baseplate subunit TssG [Chryseobacterium taeanense]
MKESLQHIASLVTSLKHDIRAEVIIGDLLESGALSENQYMIRKEGQFSRSYRFDILDVKQTDYDYNSLEVLTFYLSRDSIYDTLPEAMTHNSKNDTPDKAIETMIREYNEQKKQQKAARNFFQPFENEMFDYGLKIERFEREFLFMLNDSRIPDMFYDFWNISRDLPSQLVSRFIRLLPFAYKIVGNIQQACDILSVLLEEKVTLNERDCQQYTDESQGICLGETRLGLDSITGTEYNDYSRHLDIMIGPLHKSSFTDFIHEGKKKQFTDMFYEYFFPIEIDINTIILLPEDQQKFEFNNKAVSVLGYNTTI